MIAWVWAHLRDIRYELVDMRAGPGIWSDLTRWDRDTHPITLHSLETQDMVECLGIADSCRVVQLKHPGTTGKGRDWGREYLGYSLTEGWLQCLTEFDIRTMMQARSNGYPTEAHLAKFRKGGNAAGICKLCRRPKET